MKSLMEEKEVATFNASVNSIIKNTCIVDFGVVLKVLGKGVVKVGISVAKNSRSIRTVTCTLISPATKAFAVDIEPQEGDKVLVLYPREFKENMFKVSEEDVIIDSNSHSYSPLGAVAILYNQFRESDYKVNLKIDKNDNISITHSKATLSLDKDGYLDYENTNDTKTKLRFTSSGMTIQDKNGMNIVSTSTSIKINGHLEIK